jgi:O-antigen/teichoic acid export membrane protein
VAREASAPVIRALVGIGLLQFVSMLLLLVRTKILATTVGVQGVGTISNVDGLAAVIAQTLSLSLPFAALRYLPAALRDSPTEADLLYRRMRFVVLALIVPATLVAIVLAWTSPQLFGLALVPYRRTILLAFAGLPVVGLVPFLTNAYAGTVGHGSSMRLTVAHAAVMVVAAVAAGAGLGVDGFYSVYAVLGLALVIAAALRLAVPGVAKHERLPLGGRAAFQLTPSMWRFALWLLPLTFLTPYAGWFVKYSALKLYGVGSAGILQGAIGISLSVRALLGTAHSVFLTPNVNRQGDMESRMRWANEFQRTIGLLFALCLPPLLLFSDVAMRLLYAPSFLAGSAFVALFVAAEIIAMLAGTYQVLIVAVDRMRFHVLQNLVAQALLVLTAAIALPRIGLAGAGLAALAPPIFLFVTTLAFLYRHYGVRISAAAARSSAFSLAILVVAGGIGSRYPGFAPTVLAAKSATCVLLWLGAAVVTPPEDRARLQAGFARVMTRTVAKATQEPLA